MRQINTKVCGVKYKENIDQLLRLSPEYMGFIFFTGSKRYIDALDSDWVKSITGPKKTGVFVDADLAIIRDRISRFGLQAVQLHGRESTEECASLRNSGIEVIKAFGINEEFDWNILTHYYESVDYYLFDTKTASHGGSGVTFDWDLLTDYTQDKPYFLSGGLQLENLHHALARRDERLYALDLNSKFETQPGLKDVSLLEKAFQMIRHEQISS